MSFAKKKQSASTLPRNPSRRHHSAKRLPTDPAIVANLPGVHPAARAMFGPSFSSPPTGTSQPGGRSFLPTISDCEAAVICCLLRAPHALARIDELTPADFQDRQLGMIFRQMRELVAFDPPLLVARLKQAGKFEAVGGWARLNKLSHYGANPAHIAAHAVFMREQAALRSLAETAQQIIDEVHHGGSLERVRGHIRSALGSIQATNNAVAYNYISALDMASTHFDIDWHIPGLLARAQPCGVFAAKKSMKTTLMIALAVAVSTGHKFLGHFEVKAPARVCLMSGESGLGVIQETALRICKSSGVSLAGTGIVFSSSLPQFTRRDHLAELRKSLQRDQTELLIIDPVYLCLGKAADAGNLFSMGARLSGISQLCQELGVTLCLVHHMKKSVRNPFQPGDLDDASWSGFAEFCRQWWLINRRQAFQPGVGRHELSLSVGGSIGHSGVYGINVTEGTWQADAPRTWDVEVLDGAAFQDEVLARTQAADSKKHKTKTAEKLVTKKARILKAMLGYPEGETAKVIRDTARIDGAAGKLVFKSLLDDGQIVECQVRKASRKTPYGGYKLAVSEDPRSPKAATAAHAQALEAAPAAGERYMNTNSPTAASPLIAAQFASLELVFQENEDAPRIT